MAYSDEVLADSPWLYWRLGEASGATAEDATANNRDGTYTGVTYGVTGAVTGGDTAIGIADITDLVTSAASVPTGACTLEFWFRPTSTPTDTASVMSTSNGAGGGAGVDVSFSNGRQLEARVWIGSEVFTGTTSALTLNTWYHVAVRCDGSTAKVYLNGVDSASAAAVGTPVDSHPFTIGGSTGNFGANVAFQADEAAFYSSALSAARILAHYNAASSSPDGTVTSVPADGTGAFPVPTVTGSTAFPVVEAVTEGALTTAGTSHAVTLPASGVSTDLYLIIMDIGSTSATFNALTDWTEILDESAANGLKIWWYTGTGVPSDPTFTSSGSTRDARIAYRISGADKTITPQIGTTATGTSVSPDPPSVTPTAGTVKDYLSIAFAGMAGEEADDDTWANTPPTDWTPSPPRQVSCGTVGTNLGGLITAAERQITTGSAIDPGTFNVDVSAAWRAQQVLVHPLPPSATVTGVPADGTGDMPAPALAASSTVTSPPADGTGAFPAPTVSGVSDGTVTAPAADGLGDFPAPSVSAGASVTAPPADGTGDFPASSMDISSTVETGPGTATGDFPAPTVSATGDGTVTAPAADATGDFPAPTVDGTASATVTGTPADGTGDFPAPTASGTASATVAAAPAAGTGDFPVPTVGSTGPRVRFGISETGAVVVTQRQTGAVEPAYATGALEQVHATGGSALEPALGATELSYSTGAVEPSYATAAASINDPSTGASEVEL